MDLLNVLEDLGALLELERAVLPAAHPLAVVEHCIFRGTRARARTARAHIDVIYCRESACEWRRCLSLSSERRTEGISRLKLLVILADMLRQGIERDDPLVASIALERMVARVVVANVLDQVRHGMEHGVRARTLFPAAHESLGAVGALGATLLHDMNLLDVLADLGAALGHERAVAPAANPFAILFNHIRVVCRRANVVCNRVQQTNSS